jgi:hypothetical protein
VELELDEQDEMEYAFFGRERAACGGVGVFAVIEIVELDPIGSVFQEIGC